MLAVGPDDPVEQLLRAGIDPSLAIDRTGHERRRILVEVVVSTHAVDLGGRWEDDSTSVADAITHDSKILLEVQLEHPQWISGVLDGCRDGDQRQDHIAFADVVLDPFPVD